MSGTCRCGTQRCKLACLCRGFACLDTLDPRMCFDVLSFVEEGTKCVLKNVPLGAAVRTAPESLRKVVNGLLLSSE